VGLRERESCAILNAGLVRWAAARRLELSQAFPTADIFIGRGSGGMVSADYFERFPLVAFESINGAIVSRVVEQQSLRDAAVAIPQDGGEFASIYFVNSGQVARQEQSQFAGVIINMNGFRTVQVPMEKLDAAGAEWDGQPLVRLDTTPESATSNASLLLPAAYGIGSAQVRTEVTRVMAGLGTGRLGAFAEGIADELRGRAITAGANPLRLGIPSIEASPMAYLPEGSLIVRAQLSGESR
jgi:N-methylhydantoinase A/oxoprolinase/acetone carboxylase beta subunit